MSTINIIMNLSFALCLLISGAWTIHIIRNIYRDISAKTKVHAVMACFAAVLVAIMFTSLAIQTAAMWDNPRVSTECAK